MGGKSEVASERKPGIKGEVQVRIYLAFDLYYDIFLEGTKMGAPNGSPLPFN